MKITIKVVTAAFLISVVGATSYTPKAQAQFVVSDPAAEALLATIAVATTESAAANTTDASANVAGWIKEALRWAADNYQRVLLAKLKKRLLDKLVDQLVTWIQNPNDPRLVGDYNQLFEDAAQAAVGDTIRAIGLGRLCSGPLRARLELGLRPTQRFSETVSCTLDQVIGNVSAFRDNFTNGSWVGYQTLLEPQNNIFGLRLLAAEQVLIDTAKKQEATKAETSTGFTPQKRCLAWETVRDQNGDGKSERIAVGDDAWDDAYYKMSNPPPVPESQDWTEGWTCTQPQIITPSKIAADLGSKLVAADLDYILSADEVTEYITAISDAVINRLTTEVGTGLRGLFGGGESPARGGAGDRDSNYLSPGIQETMDDYGSVRTGNLNILLKPELQKIIVDSENLLNPALTVFDHASTTNVGLIVALNNPPPATPMGLIQCQASKPSFIPNPPSFNAQNVLTAAEERKTSIILTINQIKELLTNARQYRTDLGGASTPGEMNDLSERISELKSQALVLKENAQNTSAEVMDLESAAVANRDACIVF